MIIKTRKLPPTQTEPARMRASAADMTATLTVAFPQQSLDPGRSVALMLARAYGYDDVQHFEGTNRYRAVASRDLDISCD